VRQLPVYDEEIFFRGGRVWEVFTVSENDPKYRVFRNGQRNGQGRVVVLFYRKKQRRHVREKWQLF
jgi:hypothetical protein